MLYNYIFLALVIFLIISKIGTERKLFAMIKTGKYSHKLLTSEFLNNNFIFLGSYELIDNFWREEVQNEFPSLEVYVKKESLVKCYKDYLPFELQYKLGYYDQVPTIEELVEVVSNCDHEVKQRAFERLLIFELRRFSDANCQVILRYKKDGEMTTIKEIERHEYEEIPIAIPTILAGGWYSYFKCNGVVIAQILTAIS